MEYIRELKDFENVIKSKGYVIERKFSPSKWASAKIEVTPVIRARMSCGGGGIGGDQWYEYIKAIENKPLTLEALSESGRHVIVETYDDGRKLLNKNNIVDAKLINIASAFFYNSNSYYETGVYKRSVLTEIDTVVTLGKK